MVTKLSHATQDPADIAIAWEHAREQQAELRAQTRAALDPYSVLLLLLAIGGFLTTAAFSLSAFRAHQTGVGMIFSAFCVIALPLVLFAAVRVLVPIWHLGREIRALHHYEQELYGKLHPTIVKESNSAASSDGSTVPGVAMQHKIDQYRAPGSVKQRVLPSAWHTRPTPSTPLKDLLPEGQLDLAGEYVGRHRREEYTDAGAPGRHVWPGTFLIVGFLVLFAIGVIVGVLTRA
ncbi:MAG: hypothetical protein HOQ05_07985 [Corynebacteriales bacterium]|nr:hypothetical protein [Mycobacteriales bacterium]